MMLFFSQLPDITQGVFVSFANDREVKHLVTDSRKSAASEGAVFFAMKGLHHDGHKYIKDAYQTGIRQFVVETLPEGISELSDANIIRVDSSLLALQRIAKHNRQNFAIPVIGITGSNAKTIIKEWLFQLLSDDYKIAKNPGSYNSQLGVALSVWQLQSHHEMGIFEAGISRRGEMINLAEIIQPTIGIFSNIGSAHDEGFANQEEKIQEKLKLFSKSNVVIYCRDHFHIHDEISKTSLPTLSWGTSENADIRIERQSESFSITYQGEAFHLTLPFSDSASIENAFHCIAVMLYLNIDHEKIVQRLGSLRSVPMRLELKEGINQCQIIDDTYNNDLAGLQISLEFLSNQHQKKRKRVILSDILESGLPDTTLAENVSELLRKNQITNFIGVGKQWLKHQKLFPNGSLFFETTEKFLSDIDLNLLQQEVILVKGARKFQFEKIVNRLQRKVHGTVMEINLGAVVHNLNYFRSKLRPSTKIMVMVKAFAYGSGSAEIANVLQYHKADYLGVAYADEGIELRRNNITLPVMVMNPSEESFNTLLEYKLEPEIYSFNILRKFISFLKGQASTIHLKIDTGMHRLGFEQKDLNELRVMLKENKNLKVASIFSHLAGADEAEHDGFSREQGRYFKNCADKISQALGYTPLYHILNSPGILRLPELQFDMVRLGIGLYGVDPTSAGTYDLQAVATLKTIISQIKKISAGETIGYGRRGKAEKDLTIATIAVGYADGFSRAFSRGVGEVLVQGEAAKVIGNVCMDMTMIDITGIEAREGDEVIIFGPQFPLQSLAEKINTIPYEILTSTSERVKRVFVAESL